MSAFPHPASISCARGFPPIVRWARISLCQCSGLSVSALLTGGLWSWKTPKGQGIQLPLSFGESSFRSCEMGIKITCENPVGCTKGMKKTPKLQHSFRKAECIPVNQCMIKMGWLSTHGCFSLTNLTSSLFKALPTGLSWAALHHLRAC